MQVRPMSAARQTSTLHIKVNGVGKLSFDFTASQHDRLDDIKWELEQLCGSHDLRWYEEEVLGGDVGGTFLNNICPGATELNMLKILKMPKLPSLPPFPSTKGAKSSKTGCCTKTPKPVREVLPSPVGPCPKKTIRGGTLQPTIETEEPLQPKVTLSVPSPTLERAVPERPEEGSRRLGAAAPPVPPPQIQRVLGKATSLHSLPGNFHGHGSTIRAPATAVAQKLAGQSAGMPGSSLSWSPPPCSTLPAMMYSDVSPPATARVMASHANTHSAATAPVVAAASPAAPSISQDVQRIRRENLKYVGRLGFGAFGLVTLEEDTRTGRTYALKAVSKGYLASINMQYALQNEKHILALCDTPFIVRLFATYNGKQNVYLLMEAALGGELFSTYEHLKLYGKESYARFYVGCVTEAFAHLHERHVIYRDLKPENLLLDSRGYCKLADMGLAKITKGKTYTTVGTPDYMAPEVVEGKGHDKTYDWWMLGILLFELLVGHAPFDSENTTKVQEKIRNGGIEQVRFPKEVPRHAEELVCHLCRWEPSARICTPQLRDHRFFAGFDWNALQAQRMPAPFLPQVKGPRDLANVRNAESDGPQTLPYFANERCWDNFEDDSIPSRHQQPAKQMQHSHQQPMVQGYSQSFGPPVRSSSSSCVGNGSVPVPRNNATSYQIEAMGHGFRAHPAGCGVQWPMSARAHPASAPKVSYGLGGS